MSSLTHTHSSPELSEPGTVYQLLLFLPLTSKNLNLPPYSAFPTSEYHICDVPKPTDRPPPRILAKAIVREHYLRIKNLRQEETDDLVCCWHVSRWVRQVWRFWQECKTTILINFFYQNATHLLAPTYTFLFQKPFTVKSWHIKLLLYKW